jgi:2,3-bisphosphoglycerate-independent phosphoglycerate mutase
MVIIMRHLFYILLDGVGDRPIKELGNKTPLEYAYHPNMDYIAKNGVSGMVYTVGKGIAPESDIAVISMLGYDPFKLYTGRGPLEAFGSGMKMNDGDLALRCNFATVDENMRIIDRRCGRSLTNEEAKILEEAINKNIILESHKAEFQFKSTIGHRGVLLIRSKEGPLSDNITNTDPAYKKVHGLGIAVLKPENKIALCEPLDNSEEAKRSADLINEFTIKTYKLLKDHPLNIKRKNEGKPMANAILLRDAGSKIPRFQNINEKYDKNFASIVEMPVEKGIALLCGMRIFEFKDQFNYKKLAEISNEIIEKYDVLYVHIKGPDEPSHDGDCERKIKIIEKIDEDFFGNLNIDNNIIVITADHATPCSLKAHSDDPVPIIISGNGKDGTEAFGESYCHKGSLGILNGQDVLKIAIKFL